MDEESEQLKLLKENNMMLKELLEIARKHTSPAFIQAENDNDFIMNVVANIIAKKLETRFGL